MDEKQYTELAVKVQEIDSRSRSNEHRIDELDTQMDKMQETEITLVKLANGVDKMADQLVDMKEDIKDVKASQKDLSEKVTTLENRPAQQSKKRLDNIAEKITWLVIAGIAGYILATLLPNIFH